MRVDLDDLFWHQARDLLDYCLEHHIDLGNCLEIKAIWGQPLRMADETKPWVIDLPEEHVTWLALKGII